MQIFDALDVKILIKKCVAILSRLDQNKCCDNVAKKSTNSCIKYQTKIARPKDNQPNTDCEYWYAKEIERKKKPKKVTYEYRRKEADS